MFLTWLGLSVALASQVTLGDYYRVESADEPALSPDGRYVAFTRHGIDEEENHRTSSVWLAVTDGSTAPRQVSVAGFDASSPRFSPDGAYLVFQSRRDGDSPIWFLRMEAPGEAFQIAGVETLPTFSPDGRTIAFTRPTPPSNARPEPTGETKVIEERFTGRIYDWMQFRFDRRGYLPDPTDPHASPPEELYTLALDQPDASPRRLTELGVDVQDFAWAPDGRLLAFTADTHQRDEYVYERADLFLVDLEGRVDRLTDDGYDHSSPVFSPDGSRIAFRRLKGLSLVIADKDEHGAPLDVFMMELRTHEMKNLTASWDLRPGAPAFLDGGGVGRVVFDADVEGGHHLFAVPTAGGDVVQISTGPRSLGDFSFAAGAGLMAYASGSATSPSDVFVAAIDGSAERRLSDFGARSVAELTLAEPETIRYRSPDGTEVEGWVLLPPGYDPQAGPYPMITSIHGGPHGAYGYDFSFQFQLWAAQGYVVLYTNPRGSTGYGEAFLYGTWGGGWGNEDMEDVMAGVDFALSHYAVDPERLGVTGYSYGGFLTNWIITQTNRFRAATVGAGISNWVSDYATADIPRTKESEFYGPPWGDESGSLLRRQSPITHVQNVKTPTLFVHGETDFRVPIEQGEQMYVALKKQKVPAKFIRYPDSYHGGWTPWNTVHRYHHELEWWSEYLRVHAPTSN